MRLVNSFLLILTLILSSETTLASDFKVGANYKKSSQRRLTTADNPHSKGVGKIVGGIVTASVGHLVGLSILFSLAYSGCEEGTSGYNRCQSNRRLNENLGTGLTLGAPIIGTVMIVSGVRDRRVWRAWNEDNLEDNASLSREADFQSAQDAAKFIRIASTRRNLSINLISFDF